MKEFRYTIKDQYGLHARNAAQLAMLCQHSSCQVQVLCRQQTVDGSDPIDLMSLCADAGDELVFIVEGTGEQQLAERLEEACRQCL